MRGLAIASLVLGIIGILSSCIGIGIVPAVLALVFGFVACFEPSAKKMAIAGLVLGITGSAISGGVLYVGSHPEIIWRAGEEMVKDVEEKERFLQQYSEEVRERAAENANIPVMLILSNPDRYMDLVIRELRRHPERYPTCTPQPTSTPVRPTSMAAPTPIPSTVKSVRAIPTAVPATPTAVPPPPTASPVPCLAIGEWVQPGGLALSVTRYEVRHTCPNGQGRPPEGAKFVVIYVEARNVSDQVVHIPSLRFELDGYQSPLGPAPPCGYDADAFGNTCQWGGKLYPDVTCAGWEIFELPEKWTLDEARVTIRDYHVAAPIAHWRLEGK